ncbi:MIF-like protein mif-2 [Diadema setosum]|uniref:MIF-like protein mif-2 n=1 Tax=Diadema setosum TaxID=31175 RepID=UPI003B3B010A
MPTVRVCTNVSQKDLPKDFLTDLLAQLAKSLKRDTSHITLHFLCDQLLIRGTAGDRMCYVEVFNSSGHGDAEEIREKVIGVSSFLKDALNITDGEMIQVLFHVIPPHQVGIGTGKILTDFMKS